MSNYWHMTKRRKQSSRLRMEQRRSRHGYQKQPPGTVEREVADKLTGIKSTQRVPNRAKSRHDRAWNRGETGRQRRQDAKQARRHRMQKARQGIKSIRHELRKKLRLEVKRRMRSSVR
jgi:hypothetical protein